MLETLPGRLRQSRRVVLLQTDNKVRFFPTSGEQALLAQIFQLRDLEAQAIMCLE
jgi:hypothetical protein